MAELATAKLTLNNDHLNIVGGKGLIDAAFTPEMVRRLLALPPAPDLIWYGQTTLTAFDILSRLSKAAWASLNSTVAQNEDLRTRYARAVKNFAAFAHPTTARWPACDNLMVLETVAVDLPFLLYISWQLDGSIMLGRAEGADVVSMTPEEFLFAKGKTFREYCEEQLPLAIDKCQRALTLIAVETPKASAVSFINKDSAVEKKRFVYWQADQIDQYMHRNELSLIATEPEDA